MFTASAAFYFISGQEKEVNGKKYYSVNLDQNGTILQNVGTSQKVYEILKRFEQYKGVIELGQYNNNRFFRLQTVEAVK